MINFEDFWHLDSLNKWVSVRQPERIINIETITNYHSEIMYRVWFIDEQ